ncbi:MAG TPA: assimilatory sulfite reductase (NADPH) flavoprotein subunit [Xanthomonadaceae bacterium]|nr:assimilatory sulfite reductase (NADPH) flavoprotein subunit [Xanthomonadaceae bacterium]
MSLPAPLEPVSPLPPERSALLAEALRGLDADALLWASGFAAGLAHARRGVDAPQLPEAPARQRLTVVYGSQTGNARRLAEALASRAESTGLAVRLLRADAYPLRELAAERLLYVVISTQGDGDPPEDALAFVEHLAGRRAPKLPQLAYAVLGLGDSSYPQFCVVGRRLDERLAELGATRLFERGDADLDIDAVAEPWLDRALSEAREKLHEQAPRATVTPLRRVAVATLYTRERPFEAELLVNQRLSGRFSDRDVRHVELSLEGAGFAYEPGDALGVWAENEHRLVEQVLEAGGLNGESVADHRGERLALAEWLGGRRELTRLARPFLIAHAERAGNGELNALLADAAALRDWIEGHQVIDAMQRWPAPWNADALVAALPPLTPRLYSIASSRAEVGDEAHLTVSVVANERDGRLRRGLASTHLADRNDGERVRVFLEPNERFRLPADGDRDVIMIGPGTGVAPFRGFLQQRAATGARGQHWLFFGARRFREDFLYQLEWQRALKQGRLARLDLAFSRDGDERVYVQQRLRERSRELWAWIDGGAHLYVCGGLAMGKDVHAALIEIFVAEGSLSTEDAEARLRDLQQQGRYLRDLY